MCPVFFETQLERCQVDYFDFYLCHALSREKFEVYEKFDIYSELKARKIRGQIRHLGFSFHDTPEALEEIIDKYEWDFVQIQLNYLDWERQDAKRQYEICCERGIPCVIMEPVRGGALANLSPDASDVLKTANPDASVASWAIRYAASLPGVMTVLSGMTTYEQVVDNVSTMEDFKPLDASEYATLERLKTFSWRIRQYRVQVVVIVWIVRRAWIFPKCLQFIIITGSAVLCRLLLALMGKWADRVQTPVWPVALVWSIVRSL